MQTPEKSCLQRKALHRSLLLPRNLPVDKPADTFLDTSAFTKGEVWLNGRALGRVWNIGPQKTLYVPAPWLKAGENEVVVFDLDGSPNRSLQGLDHPVLNAAIKK